MAKKECSKGHKYDSAIYGDNCPFCPSADKTIGPGNGTSGILEPQCTSGTVVNESDGRTQIGGVTVDATIAMGGRRDGIAPVNGTVIRPAGGGTGTSTSNGKKLVGVLVTYNTNPLGECFNIYEGRNYIGRDKSSDVCLTNDSQVSGRHCSILYRSVDNKFKFKDEQSSNGTFLNEVLEDDGELQTFDVIRVGNVRLVFIAIPQIN